MLRIPLPFTDTYLMPLWPWGELSYPAQFGLLALCALPFLLTIWLYIYEMRLVTVTRATLLLCLRLVSLLLVLTLILFQPVLRQPRTIEEPGRVIIAVDRSESMDVADPQRPPVEKLRLAKALKLATDVCPDAQIEAWIKQYEQNKGTIIWTGENEFPKEEDRRAAEKQRRQQHDLVCQRVDAETRSHITQRILGEEGLSLVPALVGKHNVELIGFAHDRWEIKPDQLADLFKKAPSSTHGTDLSQPLARALERVGTGTDKPLGVILLTDGQHNSDAPLGDGQDPRERPPTAKANRLGERGVPIYPVALGSKQAPPTLAIVRLKAPPTVIKDVDAGVDADVLVTGLPRQKIVVELARVGQPPLREVIDHQGQDRTYPVHFQVRLDKVGTQALAVSAKADPNAPPVNGKLRTDQSDRTTTVNVADDRARVLLIDGEARYDFHYLNMALRRDRTMQVSSVLFEQPRLGRITEDELKKTGNPAMSLPPEPDALPNFDCIVLGDVSPEQFPLADRIRLEKYVADAGRTLVIVAGKRNMPLAFADEKDPLRRMLPISNARPFDSNQGVNVKLTADGEAALQLRMEDGTPDKSRERWSQLPPHYWGMIGDAKPGATVLAVFDDGVPARAPDKNDKEDPTRKKALIARQNYGFGRVLYVGLDSTFRWRKYEADKYHHRFWGQVIRWAASDKPLVVGNDSIRFGTREPVYDQGNEVDVVVRLAEDVPPLAPNAVAGARILKAPRAGEPGSDDAVALVMLGRNDAQPRVHEGKVRDLPPGEYLVELTIPDLADRLTTPAGTGPMRAPFSVTPRDNAEMIDLTTNWDLLTELANRSGGKVYTPEDVGELVEKLTKHKVTHDEVKEAKLLHDSSGGAWVLLAIFLGLMSAEWIGRKTAGLP